MHSLTSFQLVTAIAEVASNVASRVDESLSKQQKEYFLRQQLSAIQRELKSLNASPEVKARSESDQPSNDDSDLDNSDEAEELDVAAIKSAIEKMQVRFHRSTHCIALFIVFPAWFAGANDGCT